MYHLHHLIEFNDGIRIKTDKTIKLSIKEHAKYHKRYFEKYGHWQDKIAWLGLTKRLLKEQIYREISKFANLGKKQTLEHIEKRVSQFRNKKRNFTKEWKSNISKSMKNNGSNNLNGSLGFKWYNNGEKNIFKKIKPNGFVEGRLI
jgi:hypothetical protein